MFLQKSPSHYLTVLIVFMHIFKVIHVNMTNILLMILCYIHMWYNFQTIMIMRKDHFTFNSPALSVKTHREPINSNVCFEH